MTEASVSTTIQKEEDKKSWWSLDLEAWKKRFTILTKLNSVTDGLDRPLPPWTDADLDEFALHDPIYGPQAKLARKGAMMAATGGVLGGLSAGLFCYRHTRSITGTGLSLFFGSATSWAVSQQAAVIYYGLHNFSTLDASLKFLQWWKEKHSR